MEISKQYFISDNTDFSRRKSILINTGNRGTGNLESNVLPDFAISASSNISASDMLWGATLEKWPTQGPNRVYVNPYGSPHWGRLSSMNFKHFMWPGGSENHAIQYLVDDIVQSGSGVIGDGINCNIAQWETLTSAEITCSIGSDTDPDTIMNAYCCVDWGVSFNAVFLNICKLLNASASLIYNAGHGDLNSYKWTLKHYIETASISITNIYLGMENNIPGYDNAVLWPDKGGSYTQSMNSVAADLHASFSFIPITADTAPVELSTPGNWSNPINGMNVDDIRIYIQDNHLYFDADNATADDAINTIDVTLPERLDLWRTTYPNKKGSVASWGATGNSTLAALYVADFFRKMVEYNTQNDNYISRATMFRPATWRLDTNNDYKNVAKSAQLIGKLYNYSGNIVVNVLSKNTKLRTLAYKSGSNVQLLVINYYGDTTSIESIKVANNYAQVLHCWSLSGNSISDTNINITDLESPQIKPYSVTLLELLVN